MDFNPDAFLELLESDLNHCPRTDHVTHWAIHALRASILKKYVGQANDLLHKEAMTNFVALNTHVSEYRVPESFKNGSLFRTWKTLLYDVFHSGPLQTPSLSLSRCIDLGRCGPGASVGCETTSFLEKMFASGLSSTDKALVTYYRHRISGSRWADAEVTRHVLHDSTLVSGSKLSSVPKDCTKNRTICIEPTLNMFYQLGAGRQIEDVLRKRLSLDIRTQADLNKHLACIASVDGSLSTIDLKNASDSISIELLRELLPANVFGILSLIRSPVTNVDGVDHELAMMSTMGNGFTFPLMTLLFATLIKALHITHNIASCKNGVDWGVFGDDLIVRTELTAALIDALDQSGFTVNESKSFTEGPFRESCGGDYYLGHDVRGIYFKEIRNASQIYSAFNRLHFWSLRHGVSLYRSLVYLKGLAKFQPVPGHAGSDEGFIITADHLTSPKRNRNGSIYYRSTVTEPTGGLRVSRFAAYADGCLIAAIGGYVAGTRVLCRNRMTLAVAKRVTPCWDHLTHPGVNHRDLSRSWSVLLS